MNNSVLGLTVLALGLIFLSSIRLYGTEPLKIVALNPKQRVQDSSYKIIYGRNDNKEQLDELKKKYPNLKVVSLYRDYDKKTGLDGQTQTQLLLQVCYHTSRQ